ncbi:MAG: glycerophosphodiester phosphodiesterase family protein [Alphaproteobacteria bacterium]|nr:glycerophosphodiester phosphodiesterase family protein [Alphaproteobacteria bacterium]
MPKAAPENTLESFIAARDAGVKWIETDVKLTSDGVPVLMHDELLDRTTSGHGPIADTTWTQMQSLDAGRWFSPSFSGTRVTPLSKVLTFCAESDIRLFLEIKPSPGRTQATVMVALIEAAKFWPESIAPPVISSFDRDALIIAAQLRPDWPRSLLMDEWNKDWIDAALLTQASVVAIKDSLLTDDRLKTLRKTPLPILAYTVNAPERASELLSGGVTAVFTDDAQALIEAGLEPPLPVDPGQKQE